MAVDTIIALVCNGRNPASGYRTINRCGPFWVMVAEPLGVIDVLVDPAVAAEVPISIMVGSVLFITV
jgi:hypothetical protein